MTKVIAIDLGGTNMRVSLVNNHRVVKYIKNKTPKTSKELVDLMFKSIGFLIRIKHTFNIMVDII